ncbi:hypothetical protein GGX14DRAFT_398103 [Mycena pura]|uniref:Uncharacterized protein n=1 Tax=Mycena pura TaxID=153505 RepID=A0AAD6V7G2_9AGAR|nr:hypothetical protein GGX14DRAFT_398103 [Mycena pura]
MAGSNQKYPFSPLITQAELQFFSREGVIQLVSEDSMHFDTHTKILCRQYNQFRSALARSSSCEAAIRRAVDDLFSLVFETDSDSLAEGTYRIKTNVHVVKYDRRQLPHGPTDIATADGAVVIPLPPALQAKSFVYAGPNFEEEYIQSFNEFKGGLHNNGRQAILDSAAMQAVNRSLGLTGVKNYAFSFHHHMVDTITSWWEENGTEGYQYCYKRRKNKFLLNTPIGWFRFYSFLCRLRKYHREVRETLVTASPSSLTTRDLFCEKLSSISEHLGGGNGGSPDEGGQGHEIGMQEADADIQLGDEAATYQQISVEDFCRGESDEEDDDDDFDEDVAPKDVGAKYPDTACGIGARNGDAAGGLALAGGDWSESLQEHYLLHGPNAQR